MKSSQANNHNGTLLNGSSALNITVTQVMESESTPGAETSFENAMGELEEIVTALERGSIPLEQQIALVQRGMALADQCDATLTEAEATLEQLIATSDGELITQRLDYDEEDEDTLADE